MLEKVRLSAYPSALSRHTARQQASRTSFLRLGTVLASFPGIVLGKALSIACATARFSLAKTVPRGANHFKILKRMDKRKESLAFSKRSPTGKTVKAAGKSFKILK